jgi:uncharacterized protein (DUF58 family)
MSSTIKNTSKLHFNISAIDSDYIDKINEIQVISNNGEIIKSKSFNSNLAKLDFTLKSNKNKFYYIKVIQNNDKIGIIFFSNKIEKFIPPQKGKKHILFIIRELLNLEPSNNGTDISMALRYLADALKKRCTTFLISDFIDQNDYSKAMTIASNKHDLIAIQVYDKRETTLPNVGLIQIEDLETGEKQLIDTSSKSTRNAFSKWWYDRQQKMIDTMNKSKVDLASVSTDENFVKSLMSLFKNRSYK